MENLCFPAQLEGLLDGFESPRNMLSNLDFTPNSISSTSTCSIYSEGIIPIVIPSEVSDFDYTSSSVFSNSNSSALVGSPDTTMFTEPWLEILEQPCEMFRFRYLTESQGTPHGPVMGANSTKQKKTFPTVKLNNFQGEATIRCWLFTVGDKPGIHVHSLVTKIGQKEIKEEPHDIVVNCQNNYTASFENLIIIHAVKKKCLDPYLRKKEIYHSKVTSSQTSKNINKELLSEIQLEIRKMNMNVVTFYFEALVFVDGAFKRICEAFSQPIKNERNAEHGDLKILRTARECGSCNGGDEVFIFVKKVTKDIRIRFFEEDKSGNILWSDFATFSPLDIHHLVAIAFRTPPYKGTNIEKRVNVKYRLERPSDNSFSNSMNYIYKRNEDSPPLKRPRTDFSIPDSTTQIMSLDEIRIDESFDFILSQLPSATGDFSFSDINLDDSLVVELPAVLDTDGPSQEERKIKKTIAGIQHTKEKSGVEEETGKSFTSTSRKNRRFIEGSLLVAEVMKYMIKTPENEQDPDIYQGLLTRTTHPDNCNCFHWVVILDLGDNLLSLLEITRKYNLNNILDMQNALLQTPLHIAVKNGKIEFVLALMNGGANPNLFDSNGLAPIHLASMYFPSCIDILASNQSVDLDLKSEDGFNALHTAVKCNNEKSTEILLQSKIDVCSGTSKSGDTALHLAAINSFPKILEILLSEGMNPNAQNYAGNTPLHFSVANDDAECVALLLQCGANPFIRNDIIINDEATLLIEDEYSNDENETSNPGGQTAFDLVSSLEVSVLLRSCTNYKGTSEQNPNGNSMDTENLKRQGPTRLFSEESVLRICQLLDENEAWANVAKKLGHSSIISNIENSSNPSKILLNYVDIFGEDEKAMNDLAQVMKELDIREVTTIVNRTIENNR